ncbi:TonB-dependent receptor [Mucilaginibacter xinganensis]|uniref:SusC/RagA family TonB-linked outer membrane protein n=1 Tax=Mucilaginibacter xinganensis TaxID=1234841 RepID=A0A223NUB5_9SPHI|nr:TonB-dependent receptor [Mucilaginibacter xinganensis]ASU33101.1 SusC/RagA family TonB-linked outer membrane protein [Mucilaginibacter xinganensis]
MTFNLCGKIFLTAKKAIQNLFLIMRITVLLIIVGCLQLSAKSFSQTITLNVKETPIRKVFSAIEKQSGYGFFYRYKDVEQAAPVTVQLTNAPLAEALAQCFKNQSFTYVIENKTIVISKKGEMRTNIAAAKITVTGVVYDSGHLPLPGVNIKVKGTTSGTISDSNGKYSITTDDEATLVFSFIGLKTKEEPVNKRTEINITLEEDSRQMNEVVVIGYGNQERKDVTGAVGTVKMANIKEIKAASIDLKLAGQLAGVTVNQVTGTPGGGVSINIRGAGSVGAGDDPLYVIDGFPISPGFDQYSNPLSTINPDDIENISVLKDAASTAIYGSRGSNGVILITTKRAKKGESNITVNTSTGMQRILPSSKLQVMDAREFAQWRLESYQDAAAAAGETFDINNVPVEYRNPSQYGKGTDWFNAVTRKAPMQNYDVTVSNGTEKVRSLFSVGYFDQQGTVLNTGFQRYSIKGNMDANVAKNITMGLSIAPTYSLRNLQQTDGHFDQAVLSQAYLESPLTPVKQPDGSYTNIVGSPGTFQNANPVSELVNTTNKYTQFRTLANFYADWQVIKGLDIKSTFGVDYQNSTGDYFRPSFLGAFNVPNHDGTQAKAIGSFNSSNSFNWLNENSVNYKKTWGDHTLTLLGDYSIQQETSHNRLTYGTGYADDAIHSVGNATIVTASAGDEEWRLQSLIARAQYSFKDKYLISASIRRDGSSRFAPGHNWGTFPSVSGGWRISDESFFPKINLIDQLKFTASYGLAGNNNVGNYDYVPSVSQTNYTFGGVIAPGKSLTELGNTALGWETTRQLDIGADLSLLKGRIYLIAEYYNRYTQDMLQFIPVPTVSGYGGALSNVGNVRNRGWEFTLTTKNIVSSGFNWSSDFNVSFNRNKVISLGPTPFILDAPANDNPTSITKVGSPLGQFYGYIFAGIIQNQADLDKSPHFDGETIGNIKYKDINGDHVIDGNDQTIIGNPWPQFTFGFNNHFSYKNFDLNVVTAGSVGGHVFDMYKQFTTNLDGVFNVEKSVAQRWRSESQPGAGLLPTTTSNTNLARDYYPSYWVESNSYLMFKDIGLGYSFKTKFSKNFRVYLSAQNAILITGYKGGNPEVGIDGQQGNRSLSPNVNFTGYPVSAVYSIGCNVTF